MKRIKRINWFYLVLLVWIIGFFAYFIPQAHGYTPTHEWQKKIAIELAKAHQQFWLEIEEDPTDMGCELAEERLNRKVEKIMQEYEEQYGEMMVERAGLQARLHEPDRPD